PVSEDHPEARGALEAAEARLKRLLSTGGKRSADALHRELGKLLLENCGMARDKAALEQAIARIPALREEFWANVCVPGDGESLNQALEKANRVSDWFELAELLCRDALTREESCGGHFRIEHQTEEGEARRDDVNFSHVATWEHTGEGREPVRHIEPLTYEALQMSQRSYK
ncbi:MAG: fumarate reductase/succinate dehydrogenase flavoprotein subunit, partial [Armatimonadetes bacterium]|nr:fumarate reductase/succinate dehydrogenase flavoprotein subunit [Armatimonadota bacterium]